MFRTCFVWVYIIKGFCPLIRGKQTLVCEGFAVCGERIPSLLSLQALAGFVSVQTCACGRYSPVRPKSFYVKGNKTACLGFCCRTNFYDNMPSFLYLLVKGLRWLTNVSSRRVNVQKTWFGDRSILWYKFLGTALLQLHIRILNPCGVESLLGVFWFVRIFLSN